VDDGGQAAPVARKWHVLGLVLLAAAGAYAVVVSLMLGLWRQSSPGEGLFPFLTAGAVVTFSLAALAAMLLRSREAPIRSDAGNADLPGVVWRVSTYLAGLAFYALALDALGFAASTIVVVVLILRLAEGYSWRVTLALAVGAAAGCQVLFVRWLGAMLPTGTLWDRLFN
jgi:hypothetical protein